MSSRIRVIKSLTITDSTLLATSIAEADAPIWTVGGTFAQGARAIKAHKVWESLQDANTGNDPETADLWWTEVSPTNRWKLFDLSSTTQTQVGAADYYEFRPGTAVNAIALENISGLLSVKVTMNDPDFGVVYERETDITPVPSASSWYVWFFERREEKNQFVVSDLPSYPNATLRVDFAADPGGQIGALIMGSMRSIGLGVLRGARLGVQDYSRKERNEWGDVVLKKRGFSKVMQLSSVIENRELDNTFKLLSDLLSTPCLWIASDYYQSLSVFGFYGDFDIGFQYADYSEVTLTVEGLT